MLRTNIIEGTTVTPADAANAFETYGKPLGMIRGGTQNKGPLGYTPTPIHRTISTSVMLALGILFVCNQMYMLSFSNFISQLHSRVTTAFTCYKRSQGGDQAPHHLLPRKWI